eukprot:5359555-Alexandrium_andersonii.AAC.1
MTGRLRLPTPQEGKHGTNIMQLLTLQSLLKLSNARNVGIEVAQQDERALRLSLELGKDGADEAFSPPPHLRLPHGIGPAVQGDQAQWEHEIGIH